MKSDNKKAKVITFANQKGGCGKTTLMVNLGAIWAEIKGLKVLVIDMDYQGNAASGLGYRDEDIVPLNTIVDVLYGDCSIEEAILQTKVENLYLIPGDPGLNQLEQSIHTEMDEAERTTGRSDEQREILRLLASKIESIQDQFDLILIDSRPSLEYLNWLALVASHRLIIPVTPAWFGLEGIRKMFDFADNIQKKYNPSLRVLGIVFNAVQHNTRNFKEMSDSLKAAYSEALFENMIPRNVHIEEAQARGTPIHIYYPQAPSCEPLMALAEEVLSKWERIIRIKTLTPSQS